MPKYPSFTYIVPIFVWNLNGFAMVYGGVWFWATASFLGMATFIVANMLINRRPQWERFRFRVYLTEIVAFGVVYIGSTIAAVA